jgi:hypothetical protein
VPLEESRIVNFKNKRNLLGFFKGLTRPRREEIKNNGDEFRRLLLLRLLAKEMGITMKRESEKSLVLLRVQHEKKEYKINI